MAERKDYGKFYTELNANLKDFSDKLKSFVEDEVPEKVAETVSVVAVTVLTKVVDKTPVDTGIARANWNVAIGTNADLSITDNASRDAVVEGLVVLDDVKGYSPVTISNNMAYIGALERGHSEQAPIGMLGLTLDEVKTMFHVKQGSDS